MSPFAPDDSQRLAKVTDSTGTRECTYNIKGQILTETVTVKQPGEAPPLRYQITRTYYDEFCAQCAGGGTPDQPKQVTLTGLDGTKLDHQVSYEWDIRGNLAKVESPAGAFSYTYDPQNPTLLSSLTAPAHKVEYQYEPHRNLITSVKNLNAKNQSVISSYVYENDILGRRTSIAQRGTAFDLLQLHGQNTVQVAYNDRSEVTGYDITRLLDGAKQSGGALPAAGQPRPDAQPKPVPQFAQTYAYDSIGNRTQFLTESAGEKTDVLYESNALNQYTTLKRTEQDPENPTHDPDGNLLDDHRNHYTWNAENRCVKVEAKDGSYVVENAYDYQGRKTTRRHSTAISVKTTIYLYDGWNLLAEIENHSTKAENGGDRVDTRELQSPSVSPSPHLIVSPSRVKTHQRFYTWGRDLSGTLQGTGGVGGQLAITKRVQNQKDSVMFPCYDANGNICQMISPKAEVWAAYQYDAFGRTVDLAGEYAEENKWRFSTKPFDTATGFYYYIFRDYDPKTGRWTSTDPIEEEGGVNLYEFIKNNGMTSTDYLGLSHQQLPWGIDLAGTYEALKNSINFKNYMQLAGLYTVYIPYPPNPLLKIVLQIKVTFTSGCCGKGENLKTYQKVNLRFTVGVSVSTSQTPAEFRAYVPVVKNMDSCPSKEGIIGRGVLSLSARISAFSASCSATWNADEGWKGSCEFGIQILSGPFNQTSPKFADLANMRLTVTGGVEVENVVINDTLW